MKKALLPLLIASVIPAAAHADITLYGKVFVSFQNADLKNFSAGQSGSYTELRNNASRLGVKGAEVISEDLKAIYQYEYEVAPDNGATPFKQRNIFVGLQGTFGTVQAGQFDTPLKLAQEKTNVFKDMQGDWKLILPGEVRTPNVIQYSTPAIHDITANIAYVSGETDAPNSYTDGYSASIVYNTKPLYLALASDHNVANAGKVVTAPLSAYDSDIYRVVGRYTVGSVVLGAMYQTSTMGLADSKGEFIHNDGFNVSAIYNLNEKWALKTQYGASDALNVQMYGADKKAIKSAKGLDVYQATDENMFSIGFDYILNKKAKLHAYYTTLADDNDNGFNKDGKSNAVAKHDDKWLGVGMELSF